MPRPKICRKVCKLPPSLEFLPSGCPDTSSVILTVDEYECIRLIDHMGFSQEECAEYMQVSRATAQSICNSARKKIATALTKGYAMKIEGGDYRLCDGKEKECSCGGCNDHNTEVN